LKRIQDAKHDAVTPEESVVAACNLPKERRKRKPLILLQNFKEIFDGTLGA